MTVKLEGKNKWYCRFTINGERKHLLCNGAKSKKEAEELESIFRINLIKQQSGLIPKNAKKIPFSRLGILYTKHAEINNKSWRSQLLYVKRIEQFFGSNKAADTIQPKDIEIFRNYLKTKRGLKNSSINRYTEILSKMFNLAIDNNELTVNPVSKIKSLLEDNHKIRFLTLEEEQRLFKNIDTSAPFLRPLVTIALQTGMRRGEIFNLKWSNIDLEYGYIELLYTKSGKSRKIPISPVLKDVLLSIPQTSEYVFINPVTGKPYVDIKKSFNKVITEAKIKNFRFHDLRHTVATRMVETGVDLTVVKDILGHSSIETTMRYAHPVPERKKSAINILSSYRQ